MASIHDSRYAGERPPEAKPVSELFSDAIQQFTRLVRNEVALARTEISDKAKQGLRGGAMIGAAALVGLAALVILMLALSAFLTEMGLAASLSHLITAVIGFVIAGVLVMVGINRLKADALLPNRTINQLQRDAATLKEHL
jgi:positive regulator of sigma E activity